MANRTASWIRFVLVGALLTGCGRSPLLDDLADDVGDAGVDASRDGDVDGGDIDADVDGGDIDADVDGGDIDAAVDGGVLDADVDASGDGGTDASVDGGDAGADGGATCDAKSCPTGCCDGTGACRAGTALEACGVAGAACRDCAAGGFDLCDAVTRECGKKPPQCNATTCPNGCCANGVCLEGSAAAACGTGGALCASCDAKGLTCDAKTRACVAPTCDPTTCKGCCSGGKCLAGTDVAACGAGGGACATCGASQTCTAGTCTTPPPTCGPSNCKGCCAANGQCVGGSDTAQCGLGGLACVDCGAKKAVCTAGTCVTPPPTCGPANCAGCCNAKGVCEAGFLSSSCGEGGAACDDCTKKGSTCDTFATPRACAGDPPTCPAAFPTCDASATLTPPTVQKVCSKNDLRQARAACNQGPDTAPCRAFFAFEQMTNPSCGSCLAPFDVSFAERTGILVCVSPYVGATCNHSLACSVECEDTSCNQCSTSAETQCREDVANGQCAPYFAAAGCSFGAFVGSGAFCNPFNYSTFGAWLQGVGGHYCGQ